ncbi:flagellar protein FlaG [Thalassobacillus sp. CUG 92003]|uniref:flagellar protein FlaG n=1 Tax=Thalassobacillus sp. CUG 92003 TaxID=2736641 RepID=UPI0015E6A406|nr:flagellar protein FlaG [Thalassobacillus sp. CUG 92003]
MDVGTLLSRSHLLQKTEHISATASARDGSEPTQHLIQLDEPQMLPEDVNQKTDYEQVVESLNEFLEPTDTSLKFEFHDKLERYYVTLVDKQTDEVVKEIPPKKMLDVYAAMAEFMGFIVDEKI